MAEAILVITGGLNIPPYSTRGATQTLKPIAASSQMKRTVNGVLQDVSDGTVFDKFSSVITSNDQQVPEFIFPGAQVTVDCLTELSFKTSGSAAIRTIVGGSSRVDGAFTFYRPQLIMRVIDFSINRDDWQAISGWSLLLEEK